MHSNVNLLDYLRSKTQVDCDSLESQVVENYGPFVDGTSNQAECYFQFTAPERADLIKRSVAYTRTIHHEFPGVKLEELAVEVCMVTVNLTIVPFISGSIHIMANPDLSFSTPKIVENAKRIVEICKRWNPNFDSSRLCIKVPSTWEGLQACRELRDIGIKTLATTLFTMEQVVLAGEAGCVSISPFVHELKVHFDETYHDKNPIFGLCLRAQKYYQRHAYQTRVKACSLITADEVMMLAGVAAITIPADLLKTLRTTEDSTARLESLSLFSDERENGVDKMEKLTFINNQTKFDEEFSKSNGGKGKLNTLEAIKLFCEYQTKAEASMRSLMCDGVNSGHVN